MTIKDQVVQQIVDGEPYSLTQALLCQIGLTDSKIEEYEHKRDRLHGQFEEFTEGRTQEISDPFLKQIQTAKLLHEFLWRDRPQRYNGNFRLDEVIDAQLAGDSEVGNCVGLTSLYSILGLKSGLDLEIISERNHVKSLLIAEGSEIAIENTHPNGFGAYSGNRGVARDVSELLTLVYCKEKGTIDLGRLCDLTMQASQEEYRDKALFYRAEVLMNAGYADLAANDIDSMEDATQINGDQWAEAARNFRTQGKYALARRLAKHGLDRYVALRNYRDAAVLGKDFNLKGKKEAARRYFAAVLNNKTAYIRGLIDEARHVQEKFGLQNDGKLRPILMDAFDNFLMWGRYWHAEDLVKAYDLGDELMAQIKEKKREAEERFARYSAL